MGIRNPKRRGQLALIYEFLANLLGLRSNSIRAIHVDCDTETISIVHDDPSSAKSVSEYETIPITPCNLTKVTVFIPNVDSLKTS